MIASMIETAGALLHAALRQGIFAALLFISVSALVWAFRIRSPRVRFALFTLVLVRLCLPTDLASPVSARGAIESLFPRAALTPTSTDGSSLRVTRDLPVPDVLTPVRSAMVGASALVAVGAWLVGGLVLGARVLRERRRFTRCLHGACEVSDAGAQDIVARWRHAFGIRRAVRLVAGTAEVGPFTVGVWHPWIYVPSAMLARGRRAHLESAVAHELAHVARWDDLWIRVEGLVRAGWFFHPVAWLTGARLARERERACDEMVLATGVVEPREYARHLLSDMRAPHGAIAHVAPWGGARPGGAERVRAALRYRPRSRSRLALAIVPLAGAFLLPMSGAPIEFALPIPGGLIAHGFEPGCHAHGHPGVDIGPGFEPTEERAAVLAPAPGTVEDVVQVPIRDGQYRTQVVLRHGPRLVTLYGRLQDVRVRPGQAVRAGETLGFMGDGFGEPSSSLHFEVHVDDAVVDPEGILQL